MASSMMGESSVAAATVTCDQLRAALSAAQRTNNGGLGFHMWGVVVDRHGIVVAIAYTGAQVGDQWPGSRVIAATKANTANALSLDRFPLSTARLYSAVQPGGSLFGLQESAPVNIHAAYGGKADDYGTVDDHMLGKAIGGTNVFGGGLPLYDATRHIIGGLGVSGDMSCADHSVAWKVRHALTLDYLPEGTDDNIVYDIGPNGKSASGWGHPVCSPSTKAVGEALAKDLPTR